MPLLLLGFLALGGLAFWELTKQSTSKASGAPGTVVTSVDSSGAQLVTLAPGNMGVLQLVSSLTALGQASTAPTIDVQTPSGSFQSMSSSNLNVIYAQPIPAGGTTSGVALGPALSPGTTTLTFRWTDGSGNPQVSTFTLIGT
jgi:hypothetical protein